MNEVVLQPSSTSNAVNAVSCFGRWIVSHASRDDHNSSSNAFADLSEMNSTDNYQIQQYPLWNNDDFPPTQSSVIGDVPFNDNLLPAPDGQDMMQDQPEHNNISLPIVYPTNSAKYEFTFTPDDRTLMQIYDYCEFAGCPRYFLKTFSTCYEKKWPRVLIFLLVIMTEVHLSTTCTNIFLRPLQL